MAKLPHQTQPPPATAYDTATKAYADVGNVGAASGAYIEAALSGDQVSTWPADTVVLFDTAVRNKGELSVNGSGRFSGLKAGRTYFLLGSVAISNGNTRIPWKWYDVTNATAIGSSGTSVSPSLTSASGYVAPTTAIVTPTTDIEVEFRCAAAPTAAGSWTAQADNGWSEHNSTAQIIEIGAVQANVSGGLEYLDTIDVSGDATSVTFGAGGDGILGTALDGDVDEEYFLTYYLPDPAAAGVNFSLQPNALATNQYVSLDFHGSSSGGGNNTLLLFSTSAVGLISGGTLRLQAGTGRNRIYEATESRMSSTTRYIVHYSGAWLDTSTPITSLRIFASAASAIKAGARFILWRRTRNNVRADSASVYERRVESAVEVGSATTEQTTGHTIFSGSAVGLSVRLEEALTTPGGFVYVNLKIDGTTTLSTQIDNTNPSFNRVVVPVGTYKFGVNKNVSVEIIAAGYDNAGSVTSGITVVAMFVSNGFLAPPQETAYPPGYLDGLDMSYATVSTVSIGEGSARDSTNSTNIDVTSPLTANLAGTVGQPNSLDAGSEATNTWYALHVIADSTQTNPVASLLSLSATSPTLPAGYDVFRRVGWVKNTSAGDIAKWYERGSGRTRTFWWDAINTDFGAVLTNGEAATDTTVSCTNSAPPTATLLCFQYGYLNNSTNTRYFTLKINGGAEEHFTYRPALVSTTIRNGNTPFIPCSSSQAIMYALSASSPGNHQLSLHVEAYVDEL